MPLLRRMLVQVCASGDAKRLRELLRDVPESARRAVLMTRGLSAGERWETPLAVACRNGNIECVWLVLQHVPYQLAGSALIYASQKGHAECVRMLMLNILDGSQADTARWSDAHVYMGLSAACRNGYVACVHLLLQFGGWGPANHVIRTNKQGWTPLMFACRNGHLDCVRALLQSGPADQVLMRNARGDTPLMHACQHGSADCVRLLLQSGPADQVLLRNARGETPLAHACRTGKPECALAIVKGWLRPSSQGIIRADWP